jgi:hypothetical protein
MLRADFDQPMTKGVNSVQSSKSYSPHGSAFIAPRIHCMDVKQGGGGVACMIIISVHASNLVSCKIRHRARL